MIEITDNHTKRLILEHMLVRMEAGDVQSLLEAGIPAELLDTLRSCTLRDLVAVSELSGSFKADFNVNGILSDFKRYGAMKRYRQRQEYFVKHGATPEMLASLFNMTPNQIRTMRATLRPSNGMVGRPTMPEIAERDRIQLEWVTICANESDVREQYYKLHQQFAMHPMSALWSTINEFSDRPAKPLQNKNMKRSERDSDAGQS